MTQNEIIGALTPQEKKILESVLTIEKSKLNIVDMKSNSSAEKAIVTAIYDAIKRTVKDEA